jgi:hypothetical protein
MAGIPLGCSSSNEMILQRAEHLRRLARQALLESRRTTTGAQFRFTASPRVESELREFVQWENGCCPFLDFTINTGLNEILVDVRAPQEANAILDLLVALTDTQEE